MLAAISALVGAVAWWRMRPGREVFARRVGLVACVGVAVGSLLAILNPPPFTKPALAPWIALATGVVAFVALVTGSRARRRSPADREGV
jgi:uncharacterized membrane protein YfcA